MHHLNFKPHSETIKLFTLCGPIGATDAHSHGLMMLKNKPHSKLRIYGLHISFITIKSLEIAAAKRD